MLHPTQVYSSVGGSGATAWITITGADIVVLLANSCHAVPFPSGDADFRIDLDEQNMVDGETYYMFVTSDPGTGMQDPPLCCEFTLDINSVPVSLQSVTVD